MKIQMKGFYLASVIREQTRNGMLNGNRWKGIGRPLMLIWLWTVLESLLSFLVFCKNRGTPT
jgi:hypothetical protein